MRARDTMHVVTIGHTSVDRVRINRQTREQLGGAAVYSALSGRIFGETGIVSRVGTDFPGGFIKELSGLDVDTSGIKRVKGKSTYFEIEYDRTGAAQYNKYDLGVGLKIRPQDIPGEYLKAKGFHIAPMAATKQMKFLDYLRENTYGLISLNTHNAYFKTYKKKLRELISKVDAFLINDYEAMDLTGTRSLEHSLNALKKMEHNLIVVTMGVYGSIVIEKGEINFSPSVIQQKITDLTGCGDAFSGAFISSLIKTENPLKSANIANSIASIMATGWNFQAIKGLRFNTLEQFQQFVVSRQRKLAKNQMSIEHFI